MLLSHCLNPMVSSISVHHFGRVSFLFPQLLILQSHIIFKEILSQSLVPIANSGLLKTQIFLWSPNILASYYNTMRQSQPICLNILLSFRFPSFSNTIPQSWLNLSWHNIVVFISILYSCYHDIILSTRAFSYTWHLNLLPPNTLSLLSDVSPILLMWEIISPLSQTRSLSSSILGLDLISLFTRQFSSHAITLNGNLYRTTFDLYWVVDNT